MPITITGQETRRKVVSRDDYEKGGNDLHSAYDRDHEFKTKQNTTYMPADNMLERESRVERDSDVNYSQNIRDAGFRVLRYEDGIQNTGSRLFIHDSDNMVVVKYHYSKKDRNQIVEVVHYYIVDGMQIGQVSYDVDGKVLCDKDGKQKINFDMNYLPATGVTHYCSQITKLEPNICIGSSIN